MKQKITILAMLFTVLSFAQTTVHNTKVKLKNVNTGVVSDSLLVIAPNDEVRKIPRSVFLQGLEIDLSDYYTQTEISNLLGNYAIGDHTVDTDTQLSESQVDAFTANNGYLTTLPSNINADKIANGSVSNSEFQYINSLTSNAQTQLSNKVTKVSGKELSANDFTNALKSKLDGIEASADVNRPISDIITSNSSTTSASSNAVKLVNDKTIINAGSIIDKLNIQDLIRSNASVDASTEKGITLSSNTTGSTGFPSEIGGIVHFNMTPSSMGRNFTLWKEFNNDGLFWQDYDNASGNSNSFKEIYHSGNLDEPNIVYKNEPTEFISSVTATDFIGNWNGKEVEDFQLALTVSGSAGTLSDSKGSYIDLNFGSVTSLTIPTGITNRKWLISTTNAAVNFVADSGVSITVIANGKSSSLAIGDEGAIGQSATLIRVYGDTYRLIK